ncbi:LOW QUALITY PROTEIN: hypothetical protein CRUP_031287, partial [Coryphaenoides rupestris]
ATILWTVGFRAMLSPPVTLLLLLALLAPHHHPRLPPPEAPEGRGRQLVVIVAGLQRLADACHAYQIVHKNGIPEEQIVVMMYDDLANNEKLHRRFTPENFLAVLKGDSSGTKGGSGKVLKSGPKDHVFVYFTDHGAPGILAFPNDEACESGSMMTDLPEDIDVYATTASNSHESSYACYYDEDRETYLGDWYSVNWMEDSDVEDLTKETLAKQYKIVKKHTNTSHVQQFGNKTLAHMKVMAFQGNSMAGAAPAPPMTLRPVAHPDLTPSPDVPLAILKRKMMATNSLQASRGILMEINTHLKIREVLADTMHQVVQKVTGDEMRTQVLLNARTELTQHACYKAAVHHYKTACFNWHKMEYEYAMRHLYALVNLCEGGYATDRILQAMDSACY